MALIGFTSQRCSSAKSFEVDSLKAFQTGLLRHFMVLVHPRPHTFLVTVQKVTLCLRVIVVSFFLFFFLPTKGHGKVVDGSVGSGSCVIFSIA